MEKNAVNKLVRKLKEEQINSRAFGYQEFYALKGKLQSECVIPTSKLSVLITFVIEIRHFVVVFQPETTLICPSHVLAACKGVFLKADLLKDIVCILFIRTQLFLSCTQRPQEIVCVLKL